jgi:hypothetical protein
VDPESELKHDPEKWNPVFPKRSCSAKMPEGNRFSLKRLPSGVAASAAAPRYIVIA